MTRTPLRRRIHLLLVGLLLLAIGFGVSWWAISGLQRKRAEIRILNVEKRDNGVWMEMAIGLRENTSCTLTELRYGSHYGVGGARSSELLSQSLLDRLLHPFADERKLPVLLPIEEGESYALHLPVGEVRRLSDGEEMTLISTNPSGRQERSVSILVETTD